MAAEIGRRAARPRPRPNRPPPCRRRRHDLARGLSENRARSLAGRAPNLWRERDARGAQCSFRTVTIAELAPAPALLPQPVTSHQSSPVIATAVTRVAQLVDFHCETVALAAANAQNPGGFRHG